MEEEQIGDSTTYNYTHGELEEALARHPQVSQELWDGATIYYRKADAEPPIYHAILEIEGKKPQEFSARTREGLLALTRQAIRDAAPKDSPLSW
jgi:hypothetical protein